MANETALISPKLEGLRQELAAGNATVLNSFWREVSQQGTPLIEPIAGDDKNSLVTFIWRGGDDGQAVAVVNSFSGRDSAESRRTHGGVYRTAPFQSVR